METSTQQFGRLLYNSTMCKSALSLEDLKGYGQSAMDSGYGAPAVGALAGGLVGGVASGKKNRMRNVLLAMLAGGGAGYGLQALQNNSGGGVQSVDTGNPISKSPAPQVPTQI